MLERVRREILGRRDDTGEAFRKFFGIGSDRMVVGSKAMDSEKASENWPMDPLALSTDNCPEFSAWRIDF